jgi:Ohr subfamily peroxiredoxin
MPTKILYQTQATATGGRDGTASTPDGTLSLKLAKPRELGGNGQGNNPEQLFAAGYAACFLSAMQFVGTQPGFARVPAEAQVTAYVGIGPRADKGFALDVTLEVSLPGLDADVAERLVAEAHTVCPYSHATRGNVDVQLKLVEAA